VYLSKELTRDLEIVKMSEYGTLKLVCMPSLLASWSNNFVTSDITMRENPNIFDFDLNTTRLRFHKRRN